jgi:hypothetical protein
VVGAVLLALAVLLGAGATSLAWSQARRTSVGIAGDYAALTVALKRLPIAERLGELARRAEPGSWEHALAVEALAAADGAAQVAVVNLALAEVEHTLTEGAAWPRTGVRIALLGPGSLATVAYLDEADQTRWWASMVAIGCVAAVACFEAGRISQRNAEHRRRAIDELVAATFGDGGGASTPRRDVSQRPSRQPRRRF